MIDTAFNVLLCAAGRRPYLARWFREALAMNGVDGNIITTDADQYAASRSESDAFIISPRASDPHYGKWLEATLDQHEVDLALSVNDFELSVWSELRLDDDRLIRLSSRAQSLAEDKLLFFQLLTKMGVNTPKTWSGAQAFTNIEGVAASSERFIVKARYGSGSVGLQIAASGDLARAIEAASLSGRDRRGQLITDPTQRLDSVVVQEYIHGQEFGVDLVNDLDGTFQATLVRRKLSMRNGETDHAASEKGTAFEDDGRRLANATRHRGLIDTDVIVDPAGKHWTIDVNPRFGGGYPFSHMAGAHVPAALVGWRMGSSVPAEWLAYDVGVHSSKSVDIERIGVAL